MDIRSYLIANWYEKKAAAQVILRREEVAATRSLANTARMLESNPTLLRLKELEAWKDIASTVGNLTIVTGGNLGGHLALPLPTPKDPEGALPQGS